MKCMHCRRDIDTPTLINVCRWCVKTHEDIWDSILDRDSIYRGSKIDILKTKNPSLERSYSTVTGWSPYSGKGLIISGPPGFGKTRSAWILMRRLFDDGVDVHALTATGFGAGVASHFGSGTGGDWIADTASHQVLFIDDLDKLVLTARVQSELYTVIESMTSTGRSLIITVNSGGNDFINRFDPSVGPAIYRRVSEFCKHVPFLLKAA